MPKGNNLESKIKQLRNYKSFVAELGTVPTSHLYSKYIEGRIDCSLSYFIVTANKICRDLGYMTYRESQKQKRKEDLKENSVLTCQRKTERRVEFLKRVGNVIKDYNSGMDPVEVANKNGYSYMSMNFLLAKIRACNKGKLDVPYRRNAKKRFTKSKLAKYQAKSCTFTPAEINIIRKA